MPDVKQRIQLEGGEVIQAQLERIGAVGQAAFGRVQQAAAQTAPALTAIETGAKRTADAVTAAGQKANVAFTQLSTSARAAGDSVNGSVRAFVGPMASTGVAVRALGGEFGASGDKARAFGHVLAGIGRATHEHEIAVLGHSISLLGRYFAIAAPILLAAGLVKLASSAANATEKNADLATKLQQTNEEFNRAQSIVAGAGVALDKAAAGWEKLRGVMERAAAAEANVAKARQALNEAFEQGARLDGETVRSREEMRQSSERIVAAEKVLAEATKNSANVFAQLGISVTNAQGRLISIPELYQRLAQVLPNVTDSVQRQQVAFDLVAAGIDRKLLPALFQGEAALKRLEAAGQGFVSPITDDSIAKADAFTTKIEHLSDSFGTLINRIGAAVAALFTLGAAQQQVKPDLSGGVGDVTLQNPEVFDQFAGGGSVRGPGTSTSDSILARLSDGEFVVRSAAVQHYGVGMMHAINGMRAFAMGGLVDAIPRFADGGAVSTPGAGLHPITLQLGGDTVSGLLAPPDVADQLVRAATYKRIRRAGRRPSSYGGGGT